MLAEYPLVGFIPTVDASRARAFYVDLLGLTLVSEDPFATEVLAHGNEIRIVHVQSFTPLPFTLLGWKVPEIADAVAALTAKGIVFERYRGSSRTRPASGPLPAGRG